MKQKEVIEKLIRETKSGEMVWEPTISSYGTCEYYYSNDYKFYTGVKQVLTYEDYRIISGVLVLRQLEIVIKEQLRYRKGDELSSIYHDILTGNMKEIDELYSSDIAEEL